MPTYEELELAWEHASNAYREAANDHSAADARLTEASANLVKALMSGKARDFTCASILVGLYTETVEKERVTSVAAQEASAKLEDIEEEMANLHTQCSCSPVGEECTPECIDMAMDELPTPEEELRIKARVGEPVPAGRADDEVTESILALLV